MTAIFAVRDGLVRDSLVQDSRNVTVSFTCQDPTTTEFKYATVHVMDGQATVSRMINRKDWTGAADDGRFVTEQVAQIEEELAEAGTYWSA